MVEGCSLIDVKNKVNLLKGKDLQFLVNKGRKKMVRFKGKISEVYPSMFVIKPNEIVELERTSFSYNDVLCGDIKFKD